MFISILIALFGPKFGVFDTKLLLIPVSILFIKKEDAIFSKQEITLLISLLILSIYSFFLFLLLPPDLEFLRYFRSTLSLLLLFVIFRRTLNPNSILTIILFCLSLHSLSIYISFLFPSFQQILSELYGTRVVFQRYAGLTSGYDISGFFAIFGCYISYLFYKKNNNFKYILYALFFYGSIFFTSRVSILIIIVLTLYFIFREQFYSKFSFKKFIIIFTILTTLYLALNKYIIPIFISSIQIEFFESYSELGDSSSVQSYSKDNPIEVLENFIVLPKTDLEIFFGANRFPASDSGYIQTINTIGVFGLVITLYFYISLYYFVRNDLISKLIKFLLILTIILSIKNQYFFTRGVFELIIVLYLLFKSSISSQKNYE